MSEKPQRSKSGTYVKAAQAVPDDHAAGLGDAPTAGEVAPRDPAAPVPFSSGRVRAARLEQQDAIHRLIDAASGLAHTIALTEELMQRRAEIVERGAARGLQPALARTRPHVVSLAEAARRTGRHPEVLRRWCIDGRIPAIRVGRTWALAPETVTTLMAHAARSRPRLPTSETA